MIAKIQIELDLPQKESISFLKSNVVTLKQKAPFFGTIEHTAIWSNLENPKNFKFKLNSFGPINPWWGKCSIDFSDKKSKSILSILILPPYIFLFFAGVVLSGVVYSIIQFGIHNYGTNGFLPSIIVPTFFVGLMILIWSLIAKHNAKKIKQSIIESFDAQIKEEN